MHKIRILRTGSVVTVVHIEDYDIATNWAYETMKLSRAMDADGIWAATLETGTLLWDPLCKGKDLFIPDGMVKEGLVLDKKMLRNPKVDLSELFGLS